MRGGGERAAERLRVLGVDPGTAVTGWGVVERRGGAFVHLAHGTIVTAAADALPRKLIAIHRVLAERCAEWAPDTLALEKSFVGRNVQSAFRLGEVRGVTMLVAAMLGLPVAEYSPAEVKLAVTGTGAAEKPQVACAVVRELALAIALRPDAADALALAICHLQSARMRLVIAAGAGRAARGSANGAARRGVGVQRR
jgi:crossover junction endodeoxyribonuclease RuvC